MQRIFMSTGSGKPVSVEIQGPDLAELERTADRVRDIMTNVPGAVDVTIVKPDYRKELWVDVDRERICRVEAEVLKRSTGEVVNDTRRALEHLELAPGITLAFGGDAEEQAKSFRVLLGLLLLGIVLVYMVMAGQFESYKDPFVIMFSVPFAFTGAIWFMLLTGNRLNVMSFIGVIMLIGVVVNNAIVLIDYIQQLRRAGSSLTDAITVAGATRLRPVLMTTITTVVGAVPMAFGRGEGAEQWQPLGAVVIGGLSVSTLVTLVLVPVVYSIVETMGARRHAASATTPIR
jgi:HAE1 family hydrophobic/amphiphilic exporter-1